MHSVGVLASVVAFSFEVWIILLLLVFLPKIVPMSSDEIGLGRVHRLHLSPFIGGAEAERGFFWLQRLWIHCHLLFYHCFFVIRAAYLIVKGLLLLLRANRYPFLLAFFLLVIKILIVENGAILNQFLLERRNNLAVNPVVLLVIFIIIPFINIFLLGRLNSQLFLGRLFGNRRCFGVSLLQVPLLALFGNRTRPHLFLIVFHYFEMVFGCLLWGVWDCGEEEV